MYINTFLFQNEYLYRKDYMYKNFNLTEAEKEQILNRHKEHGYKKPLNNDSNDYEALIGQKIANSPKLANRMDAIVSNLSDDQLAELEMVLDNLNVTSSSSPQEIHNKLESMVHSERKQMEMPEAVGFEKPAMSKDEKAKREMIKTFEAIGGANIAAWGGVPAAMVIGAFSSMPIGFAVSWGVTAVLYTAASAIKKTIEKNKENIK